MATINEMLDAFRFSRQIKFVALTGGPCGGKSTFIKMATSLLKKHGYKVILVPEVARELIGAGLAPWDPQWRSTYSFQKQVLLGILEKEFRFREAIRQMILMNQPVVFLCDRGLMDGAAYVGKERFRSILGELEINPSIAMDRYDLVIHLVTAADGAEQFYVTDTERRETPEEARDLDKATLNAWNGHLHHVIVGNETDFSGKINNALLALKRTLNMPEAKEIELKYWVKDFNLNLLPANTECFEIRQTYLDIPEKPGIECRVRVKIKDGSKSYYYTEKTDTEIVGDRAEFEEEITQSQYQTLIKAHALAGCEEIVKLRYKFPYGTLYVVEIDVYQGRLEGLVVLEIEVKTVQEMETITPPNQFDLTNVTGRLEFSNRGLAEHGLPSEVVSYLHL